MDTLETLAKRLHDTEQQILRMMREREQFLREYLQQQLTFDALCQTIRSMGAELAAREGISEELFLSRFQALNRWHLDAVLRTASDRSPNLMGQIDGRKTEDIPTDDNPPLLFSPPQEDEHQ